jgi:hypothetical protein
MICHRRASYQWGIDLDKGNIQDGMPTARRPVLQVIDDHQNILPISIDIEAIVVERYRRIDDIAMQIHNRWLQVVTDAVTGVQERFWLDKL